MPNREDENLDVIAGLSANRDDDLFARQPKTKAAATQPRPARPAAEKATAPQKTGSGGTSAVVVFVLLVLVAACGWLGWQGYQMQQQLAAAEERLEVARNQLDLLGAKLSETGDSFSETGTIYDKQFKLWESEIRKLWVVANERNKKAIADNKAGLSKANTSLKQAVDAGNAGKASGAAAAAKVERLGSDMAAENTALKASLEEQSEQLMLVRGELELLQKRLGDLPTDLGSRVKENEDAVQAIDAARRQLVNSMTQLQQRVNELQLSIDGGSPLP